MRSSHSAPLWPLAIGIVVLGGLLMQWAGKEAQRSQSGDSVSPAGQVSNHSETVLHSANVQAAGDFHVEAQLSRQGTLVLYIYGAKEKQLFPIPVSTPDLGMEAAAVISGEGSEPVTLTARPISTDPAGMTSRFIGKLGRSVEMMQIGLCLTLPIENRTYRLQWRPEHLIPGAQLPDASMPQAVGTDEARKLFLTPGGLYTEADIAANGRQTATQKYGSQMSQHNAHPKPGERICPITDTTANPKFAWIVGGKTYLFCCPPCIEEFIKRAKEKPATIKAPESYIKL
ncbi:hypothetical protein [Armatimonas sp.]|uniref:hypothetical protein n=1 Tax=Armatimonas sp. TaxID=1872638 RepID=UPI00286D02DC|nr:hypothetical protein [Armatimonas sp.]